MAPSGLRFRSSAADLNPLPLLSSGCLSPRSFTSTLQPHPHALASAPLLGFRPLQRSTESGVRIPADPTTDTVRPQGFSPSRRLTPPETMWGLFHPHCAPGVLPASVRLARTFRSGRGDVPGFPLHGLLLPRDEHVLACPPVLCLAALIPGPFRSTVKSDCRRYTVSITGESVYPKVASQGHQPS